MAGAADDKTFSGTSSDDDSDVEGEISKRTDTFENLSDDHSSRDYEYEEEDDDIEPEGDDDKDAKIATEEDDVNEEAYRRYEERSSFNHARIEIDEDYEEDLGFPMYYAGYTHRKKQLPIGMDCWKVKSIPADMELLKEMIQDQKVRRDLLTKVMEEVALEKTRVLQLLAEQEA